MCPNIGLNAAFNSDWAVFTPVMRRGEKLVREAFLPPIQNRVNQTDKILLILCYREAMIKFMFVKIVWNLMKNVMTPVHHVLFHVTFRDTEKFYENVTSCHPEKINSYQIRRNYRFQPKFL